jgi:hypothetical protein
VVSVGKYSEGEPKPKRGCPLFIASIGPGQGVGASKSVHAIGGENDIEENVLTE